MTIEFSYYQCKDGHYGVCNVPPEYMYKHEEKGIWVVNPDCKCKMDDLYYTKKAPEGIWQPYMNPEQTPDFRIRARHESNIVFSWSNLLDLTNVPTPKWEDKSPILVVLEVNPKTSYYVYD